MIDPSQAPTGSIVDPDDPDWMTYGHERAGFAPAIGKLQFRRESAGRAIVRMIPDDRHLNPGGSIHGGAVMGFLDMAMFAGARCAGLGEGRYVTLDMTTHFLAAARLGEPMDAHIELLRETRSFAFVQGVVRQAGEACYSSTGTLKRLRPRSSADLE